MELGDCEDFLRLNLADEDYAYVPPWMAEAMGLGVQDVELEGEEVPAKGDREGEPDQAQEEPVVEEVADREEEVVAARTRKRKERVNPAREGPSKRSRRDSRSGGSASLAEVAQALEGTGEAQPYLAQMAYDMRHRTRDMHVLEDVDPPAGMALAMEKLTRVSVYMLFVFHWFEFGVYALL